MPVSPIPRGVYPSVTALDPEALRARGITLVLADLDNTLVPYGVTEPPEEIVAWKQALEDQGIQLFLLSNSRRPGSELRPAAGHPLSGTLRQAKAGGLSPGHGAHGAQAGGDRHGGRPDLH